MEVMVCKWRKATTIMLFTFWLVSCNCSPLTLNVSILVPWTDWVIGANGVTGVHIAFIDSVGTLLPRGTKHEIRYCDTVCNAVTAVSCYDKTKNKFQSGDVDVFIGDGCSSVCKALSALAAADNTAIISFDCNLGTLSDKVKNPTFTRAVSPYPHRMFTHLMKYFNWDRVALFIEDLILYTTTGVKVKSDLEAKGIKVYTFIWSTARIDKTLGTMNLNNLQTLRSAMKLAQKLAYGKCGNCAEITNFLIK